MQVRQLVGCAKITNNVPHDSRTGIALHINAHGPAKRRAMAGHVDFRNQFDMAFVAIGDQFFKVVFGIELPFLPGHIIRCRELRVTVEVEPPGHILCKVKVEDIQLVPAHDVDLLLEKIHRLIIPANVHHIGTPGKSGPVADSRS